MKKTHFFILLAVVISAFIAFSFFVSEHTSSAQQEADAIYSSIRDKVAGHITNAEVLMKSLSQEVSAGIEKNSSCEEPLKKYLEEQSDIYDVFLLVTPDGDLYCTPKGEVKKKVNFSDRNYYTRAIETREFAIGEFLVGKVSGLPVLAVALPILNDEKQIKRIIVAGIKTTWLEAALKKAGSHDESLLVELQDHTGVLLRYFADGRLAEPGVGRTVELVRLPLFEGYSDAEIVIFQKT